MQKDRPLSIEHCISLVSDRFELVSLISQRARDIGSGHQSVLKDLSQYSGQKPFSVALHEMDMELLNVAALKERYLTSFAPKNMVEADENKVTEVETENLEQEVSSPESAYYVSGIDLDIDSAGTDPDTSEHIFFEDIEIDETEK